MRSIRILSALLVIAAFTGFTNDALAQNKRKIAEQLLDVNGAQGKEFWIAIPPNEIAGYPTSSLEIYVASAFDTDVEIYEPESNTRRTRRVTAGQIRTLSTASGETNWSWEIRQVEQVVRKAIRLRAAQPISVYVLNAKRFSSDGYLAIPVQAWGNEYIACTYSDFREFSPWAGGFCIIAKENGTTVEVELKGTGAQDAKTSGGKTINTGQKINFTMDEGDIWMVKGDATTRATFDLTGSSVRSSRPVGFLNFHERTTMPNLLVNGNGRNHLIEMAPSVNTWGKRYVTIEYKRNHLNGIGKGDVFRVVASQPNTKWTLKYYDPITKQLLGQGGGPLAKAGDFADISQSPAPANLPHGLTVWTADKPIFVMQYSCSSTWDGDPDLDPFMINVVPEEQYITTTIFQAPTLSNFSNHFLNLIVYADTADVNYTANLKSLEIDSIPVWSHPKASAPTLLFTRLPGTNTHFCTIGFGTEAKSHRIRGNGKVKFGGYIYGFGSFDAYGWPAAAGFRPTSSQDTMPPVIIEDSLCGDYDIQVTELRNIPNPPVSPPKDSDQVETGISDIDFVVGAPNTNYRIVLLTAQDFPRLPPYKTFRFRMEVIDKGLDAYAEIRISDFGSSNFDGNVNYTLDTVRYFAADLVFTPTPLSFGKRRVGTKPTLDVTVKNEQTEPITITDLRLKTGLTYRITSGAIPPAVILAAGQSHSFTIEYDAKRDSTTNPVGKDIDTLIVKAGCSEFKLPISGFALEPKILVEDFDAGTVGANELRCKSLRIENPGSDTLVITDIQGYQGTNFSLSTPYTPTLPIRIAPKGVVFLDRVCYQRADIGTDDKDITLTSDAASGDSVSKWTGNTQSPGPNILGYDWRQRRVNTVHQALGYVYNSGNQPLTLRDVTFADGSKFYPPGSDATNYVFQIVGLYSNGQPVTSLVLVGNGAIATDSAEVLVLFRPAAEVPYLASMKPVFDETAPPRTADLEGEGILPQIALVGWNATCAETPYGVPLSRNLVITNLGSMPLTIQSVGFLVPPTNTAFWQLPTNPVFPAIVPANGGTLSIPVVFTRAAGNDLASTAVVEVVHDAVPGNGIDSNVISPRKSTQDFVVGSCTGPDIVVEDLDYNRQLANCDAPTLSFPIKNTGGGLTELEIREINPIGADAAAFVVTGITRMNGTAVTLPLTIPAGQEVQVAVRFTPTEPNAAPWADRVYAAQFEVKNYAEGDVDELKPGTVVNVRGIGYVVPVSIDLTNTLTPGETRNPGTKVDFTVAASSALWNPAAITTLTVDVIYATRSLVYVPGSATPSATGWTVGEPTITTDAVDPTKSRMSFVLAGPAISANTNLFSFRTTLLLGNEFVAYQTLEVKAPRACIVTTTTGDSTTIFNCALARRVVSISGTQTSMAPVTPNPVSDGTLSLDFGVGISALTTIDLVDAQGEVVRTLVDSKIESGEYTLTAPTAGLANGTYFIRLRTLDVVKTQRLVVVD